jgi:hypothetical protein
MGRAGMMLLGKTAVPETVFMLLQKLMTCRELNDFYKDIAAMKVNAIANRGSKKDFWDYASLLDRFTTEEMLSFFHAKYSALNAWHAEKALLYFDDAEDDPDPVDRTGRSRRGSKHR